MKKMIASQDLLLQDAEEELKTVLNNIEKKYGIIISHIELIRFPSDLPPQDIIDIRLEPFL